MAVGIGDVIGERYEIFELLSEGTLANAFECFDQKVRRKRTLRVLLDSLVDHSEAIWRFNKSILAPGMCESEHVLDVFDAGQLPSGALYSVGELFRGASLSARLQERGTVAPREIAPIALGILDTLADIHDAGIVFRNVSPDAIFLSQDSKDSPDFVMVADFELARFPPGAKSLPSYCPESAGSVIGTPYYMSPEQAKGSREIDGRSDIYSLGVLLYEAVTGQMPFDAETFNELIFKIVLEPYASPRELVPDLDERFAALITKAMSRYPEERYSSVRDLHQALSAWLASS